MNIGDKIRRVHGCNITAQNKGMYRGNVYTIASVSPEFRMVECEGDWDATRFIPFEWAIGDRAILLNSSMGFPFIYVGKIAKVVGVHHDFIYITFAEGDLTWSATREHLQFVQPNGETVPIVPKKSIRFINKEPS